MRALCQLAPFQHQKLGINIIFFNWTVFDPHNIQIYSKIPQFSSLNWYLCTISEIKWYLMVHAYGKAQTSHFGASYIKTCRKKSIFRNIGYFHTIFWRTTLIYDSNSPLIFTLFQPLIYCIPQFRLPLIHHDTSPLAGLPTRPIVPLIAQVDWS